MKMLINSIIGVIIVFLLGSCSTTGSMRGNSLDYGYYDNMYYGNPSYYGGYGVNPYLYPRTRIIHNNVIVVPEKRKVERRENVRRRETVSPNSRRTLSPSEPNRARSESNRTINSRQNTPSRDQNSVAPTSRRSASPEFNNSSNSRRRGN